MTSVVQNVAAQGVHGNAFPVPIYGPCLTRYQEATLPESSSPRCRCGMNAVAACSVCGAALCGDHYKRDPQDGAVLCDVHHADVASRRQLRAALDREAAEKSRRDRNRAFEERALQYNDPAERALHIVASGHVSDERSANPRVLLPDWATDVMPVLGNPGWRDVGYPMLQRPAYDKGWKASDPFPDGSLIVSYFAHESLRLGRAPHDRYAIGEVKRGLWGSRYVQRSVTFWAFTNGSARERRESSSTSAGRYALLVDSDGRTHEGAFGMVQSELGSSEPNCYAIWLMAKLLNFAPIE